MTGRRMINQETLRDLEKAVAATEQSERARDEALFRAHAAGNSLRVLAETSRLSHENVRTRINRIRSWIKQESLIIASGHVRLTLEQSARADRALKRRTDHLAWLLNVKNPDTAEGTDAG